jgi:transcriptional regulator with XRE-family HTH domain
MPAVQPPDTFANLAAQGSDINAVRAIRETRGYSIEKLSFACGLASDELADIESGKDTDPAKLRRIALALMLPEDALITPN